MPPALASFPERVPCERRIMATPDAKETVMFKQIVVPLDGSSLAQSALPYALAFADAGGGRLTLFQAVPPASRMLDYNLRYEASDEAAALAKARDALDTIATDLQKSGRSVGTAVAVGDADAEILRYTERTGGDLIAMATHGRGGVLRWAFGSVARKVLPQATVPVLIVRPAGEPERPAQPAAIRTILVPLDGSERAEAVVPLACDIARAHGARVTLARAVPFVTMLIGSAYEPMVAPEYYDEIMEEMRAGAQKYLTAVSHTVSASGVPVETVVKEGDAPLSLLEMLDTNAYDLVIMSTHGRTGVKRWVLGSVAERLVEAAHTPVLLIRSRD